MNNEILDLRQWVKDVQAFLYPLSLENNELGKEAECLGQHLPTIFRSLMIIENDLAPLETDYSLDECPVCGASPDQQCSIPDPNRDGFGIELGSWVHRKRMKLCHNTLQ